jgi:hypothetical protein
MKPNRNLTAAARHGAANVIEESRRKGPGVRDGLVRLDILDRIAANQRALTPPLPSGAWHPEHFAALAHYRAARKERVYALSCRVWEFQF